MITTVQTLAKARTRWFGFNGDARLFEQAITVLDAATCNADVKNMLTSPPYSVTNSGLTNPDRSHVYTIRARGRFMLEYVLTEVYPDADVEILP